MSVLQTIRVDQNVALPTGGRTADARPDPTFMEGLLTTFRSARDDQMGSMEEERNAAYLGLYSDLVRAKRPASRYFSAPDGITPVWNYEAIWQDAVAAGLVSEDRATFDKAWQNSMRERMAQDQDTASRSGWAPWLIGGMAGAMTDPINVASMALGGGPSNSLLQLGLREAGINAAVEAVQQPLINVTRQQQGRPGLTLEEAATNIGVGAAAGFLIPTTIKGGANLAEAGGRRIAQAVPLDIRLARALGKESLDQLSNADLARAFRDTIPQDMRLPDEVDALHVIDRGVEVDATSPFRDTYDGQAAHRTRVTDAALALDQGRLAPTPAPVTGRQARATVKQRIAVVESGGKANAKNPNSTATGKFQFIQDTWLRLYRARFGDDGRNKAEVLALRRDSALQDVLMDDLMDQNIKALQRAGIPDTSGNIYLAHFAGPEGAARLHRADPRASAKVVLGKDVVAANKFLEGMSARDVIAWAHRKMGDPSGVQARAQAAPRIDDSGYENELAAALEAQRASVEAERLRLENAAIDAEEMQFAPTSAEIADDAWNAGVANLARVLVGEPLIPLNRVADLASEFGVTERELRKAMDGLVNRGELRRTAAGQYRRLPRAGEAGAEDAMRFIARNGGIAYDGLDEGGRKLGTRGHDLRNSGSLNTLVPGGGPLLRPTGRSLDQVGELLHDAGYFGPPETTPRPTDGELITWLDNSIRTGDRRFSFFEQSPAERMAPWPDEADTAALRLDAEAALARREIFDAAGDRYGIPLITADDIVEIEALMRAGIPVFGKMDPADALDAAALAPYVGAWVNRKIDDALDDAYFEIEDGFYDFSGKQTDNGEAGGAGQSVNGRTANSGNAGEGPARAGNRQGLRQEQGLTPAARDAVEADRPSFVSDVDPALARFAERNGDGYVQAAESDWHDLRAATDAKATFDLEDGKGPRSLADIEEEITADDAAIGAIKACLT